MILSPGTTSVSIDIQLVNDGSLPQTGKLAADFPAVYFSTGARAQSVAITLHDLAAIDSAYSAGGIHERAGASGIYRLDLTDAALANAAELRIYGDATGKHVISTIIDVRPTRSDMVQIANFAVNRFAEQNLPAIAQGSAATQPFTVLDASSPPQPVNLSSKQVRFVLSTVAGVNPQSAVLTPKVQYDTANTADITAGKIAVGGVSHNVVTVTVQAADTTTAGRYEYFLWNITDNQLLASGDVWILQASKQVAA